MFVRFFDILFSLSVLFFLIPLFVLIIFILSITGEREIFYRQQRVGFLGKNFSLFKFATMLKDSPSLGAGEITLENDSRVLPFGQFLRKSKINELPQLFNILLGHMSIVGPRPMVPNTFLKYSTEAQLELNKVKPGLTGIGSIFFRDEEKYLERELEPREFYEKHIIPYKNELEIWFVKNRSTYVYFKVICITAWVVLFPKSQVFEKVFDDLPAVPEALKIPIISR